LAILPAEPVYCRPTPQDALLEEAGLVDHQHRVRVGQRLQRVVAHDVAQRLRVPAATAEDGLLPPRPGVARRLGAHPAGLAPLVTQQPIQKQPRRSRRPVLREQGPQARLHVPKRRRPKLQRVLDRCTHQP